MVSITSKGDAVTLAKIMDRMIASGYGAGGSVVVAGVAWRDLCVSPCTVTLDAGLHELMVYGDGISAATHKFDLRGGDHELQVDPGSAALSGGGTWLAAFGIVAVVLGGTFLVIDADDYGSWALPTTIGGAAGTGVGIGMMIAGRTSFEQVSGPGRTVGAAPELLLDYQGSF